MTSSQIQAGLDVCKKYHVATACVKPYAVAAALEQLRDSDVLVCPVIGFPAGNSTTSVKVFEATEAVTTGGREIDMVVNIGKVLDGDWRYVEDEIIAVDDAVQSAGSRLKVIFENDYLEDGHIIQLCKICTRAKVAFVKTSTGYGFVKNDAGTYQYAGAQMRHLRLMREHSGREVEIKAAGGVRTLDDLLLVKSAGVSRVGATATEAILEEAIRRGIGKERVAVSVPRRGTLSSGY